LFAIIMIFLVIGILFFTAVIAAQSGANLQQIKTSIQNYTNLAKGWNPLYLVTNCLLSFFSFVPIYFSFEKKGILGSIRRSLFFSFKNLNFVFLIILVNAISYSVSALIPFPTENNLRLMARTLIGQYFGFIITAS